MRIEYEPGARDTWTKFESIPPGSLFTFEGDATFSRFLFLKTSDGAVMLTDESDPCEEIRIGTVQFSPLKELKNVRILEGTLRITKAVPFLAGGWDWRRGLALLPVDRNITRRASCSKVGANSSVSSFPGSLGSGAPAGTCLLHSRTERADGDHGY
jgi:hypothetical protein